MLKTKCILFGAIIQLTNQIQVADQKQPTNTNDEKGTQLTNLSSNVHKTFQHFIYCSISEDSMA